MYSVAVGIRPYGQLVEHYDENMLCQMHLFFSPFFKKKKKGAAAAAAAASHLHRQRKGSQKVSQNSSLLMDGCVFVHVASSMWYIIHSGGESETEEKHPA